MCIRTGLRRKMIGLLYKSRRKKFLLLVTFAAETLKNGEREGENEGGGEMGTQSHQPWSSMPDTSRLAIEDKKPSNSRGQNRAGQSVGTGRAIVVLRVGARGNTCVHNGGAQGQPDAATTPQGRRLRPP